MTKDPSALPQDDGATLTHSERSGFEITFADRARVGSVGLLARS